MKKYLTYILLILFSSGLFGQGICNNGAKIVVGTGSFLRIGGTNGNYRNEANATPASIDLSGTITVTGNVINNVTGTDIIASSNANSNVILSGTRLQTLSGSSTSPFVFPNLIINNTTGVNLSTDVNVTSIIIKPNAKLTLNSGYYLTATIINIFSDITGTGTYVDNGITNISSAKVQQYLTADRNWYLSSPVTSATSGSISTATSVNSFEESTSTWILESSSLKVLKGYVASIPTTGTITFNGGVLNTGALSNSTLTRSVVAKTGFNLVGNPYPSYLNWLSAYAASPTLEPTMWYRTRNNAPTPAYVFDTFNATPGVGTNNNGFAAVTGFVPPMQAFWVRVLTGQTTGTLSLTNAMRTHQDVTTNRLKTRSQANSAQQLLRLQVSNGINSDEAIVLFNSKASDDYDAYDSGKMSNDKAEIPEIYTFAGNEKLVINGLNNVSEVEEIPLGFKTGENNTFTIKATEISNFDSNTKIILKDKQLGSENELKIGNDYSFSSEAVSTPSRFSILFRSASVTTGLNNNPGSGNESIFIFRNQQNQITVHRNDALGEGTVTVCNAIGQKLVSQSTTGTVTVVDKKLIPGVYLVRVNVSGQDTTKKIILN